MEPIIYVTAEGTASIFLPEPKLKLGPLLLHYGNLTCPIKQESLDFIKWFCFRMIPYDKYQQLQISNTMERSSKN